jgi:hypothetical protein
MLRLAVARLVAGSFRVLTVVVVVVVMAAVMVMLCV